MPAAPAATAPRPAFRDGQVLRAADLRDEAAAIVSAAARHPRAAHRPGIVAGLWLHNNTLSPGMAVDADGRSILVPAEYTFRSDIGPPVEVWIAFAETEPAPGRVADGYEFLFETPGRYDPARPAG